MKLSDLLLGIEYNSIGDMDREISDVVYDTRKEMRADTVFVCIAGYAFDGHSYASEAYARGVRVFAAEKVLDLPEDATVLYTESTRKFLALSSANLFGKPTEQLLTVAVTGTQGKTSTSFI